MLIFEDNVRACTSRDASASAAWLVSTLFSDDCVDMDDCNNALDISSACTLRSRSVSRSLELASFLPREMPFVRRARRGVNVRGGGGGL